LLFDFFTALLIDSCRANATAGSKASNALAAPDDRTASHYGSVGEEAVTVGDGGEEGRAPIIDGRAVIIADHGWRGGD
jgi:hypothetical protein